ncbi:hypothetical protein K432DRAFT_313946, partial [Lepidopterella palustris CBS 459.81]
INLELGIKPKFKPLYKVIKKELKTLRKRINKNLVKGYIRLLKSKVVYLILFIDKKGITKLRIYIDF